MRLHNELNPTSLESSLPSWLPSAVARERMLLEEGGPLFSADWDRTLMLHFEVAPEALQPFVPFELELRQGKAYVSLVAFTMRDLAPLRGGRLAALAFKPIASHEFLNVRTYVRHEGEAGIHFLAEYVPNQLSALLGGPIYGLPYRIANLAYEHDHEHGSVAGRVTAAGGTGELIYQAKVDGFFETTLAGRLEEFLVEHYLAFTEWRGIKRRFRVWHAPWRQCPAEVTIEKNTLMELSGSWAQEARFVGANYSPGVVGVWKGRPRFI